MSAEVQALPAAPAAEASAQPGHAAEANTQPTEMGEVQQAALKEVARLRGDYGKASATDREALTRRIVGLQRFAFGHGDKPADFMPGEAPPPDTRPHDSLRDTFEKAMQPANESQMNAAVTAAIVQGVEPGLARQAAEMCTELGLSDGHARTVLDRVRAHHGATHGHESEGSFAVLADHEVAEYISEAARFLGSQEKLEQVSQRAREFLAHKGVLEKFDKARLTRSTLAYDPKLLHTLAMAADAAGVPRGGKRK